ncbi:MAG: serine/threonine-protein kinase [Leptolyngbyaceae cyanobacterium MO_188.B28]|nr:serine/threonine-protein kinase [Leptolyngbyaceae cyanobacterium MO_188.B28]
MLISKLCDRYEILHNLGSSGAVSTYVARDTHLPNYPQCIVKKIVSASSDLASLKQVRVYFKREAELLGILGAHAQIPKLIDYFEANGAFYLVQELIEGDSLNKDEIAPRHLPWSEIDVIKFLNEMLGILQFVHEHQVIHGDIKPKSIIRRFQDGKLVLTNFDAIKLVQIPNQPISAPGTPGYMAPEQASGMHFASDIYALGVTAIQALTGVEPRHLPKDAKDNITCPGAIRISDGLAAVLNKMVCSDYKERYQSAVQTLTALKQIPDVSQGSKKSKALVPKVPKKRTDETRSPISKRLWKLALIPVVVGIGYGPEFLTQYP